MGSSAFAIGKFHLEYELASGPFGRVYTAVDPSDGYRVAVKVHCMDERATAAEHATWAERVVREAQLTARFRHPAAVAVHDVGLTSTGLPYVVRDYVHGRPLADYAVQAHPDYLPHKLRWLRDYAAVVASIHEAGFLHRGVKPQSALVRHDGALRVLEFGVARRSIDRLAGVTVPRADRLVRAPPPPRFLGTPAYVAPEQLAHVEVGREADQFAWAVTAYEVLTGDLPWGRHLKPVPMIEAMLTTAPRPLLSHGPVAPAAIEAVIHRALEPAPERRNLSMAVIVDAFASFVGP